MDVVKCTDEDDDQSCLVTIQPLKTCSKIRGIWSTKSVYSQTTFSTHSYTR